jgi:hypothetical protein
MFLCNCEFSVRMPNRFSRSERGRDAQRGLVATIVLLLCFWLPLVRPATIPDPWAPNTALPPSRRALLQSSEVTIDLRHYIVYIPDNYLTPTYSL